MLQFRSGRSHASRMTSQRKARGTRLGRPLRGRSLSAFTVHMRRIRSRHFRAVCSVMSSNRAIPALLHPPHANATIFARSTMRCGR
jgi:hypothetical protein